MSQRYTYIGICQGRRLRGCAGRNSITQSGASHARTRNPEWQAWLREHQPPLLITWGRDDPFFPEPGAHAYLRDVPGAELHLFDTGHFALEDHLPEIAPLVADFLDRTWKP